MAAEKGVSEAHYAGCKRPSAAEPPWPSVKCPVPALKPSPEQRTEQSRVIKSATRFLQGMTLHFLVRFLCTIDKHHSNS